MAAGIAAGTGPAAPAIAPFVPVNIVALDQEHKALVAVINGAGPVLFDPGPDLDRLPPGGGYVVADGNAWSVRNELSQSQYCWADQDALETFLAGLAERGYRAVTVANKLANTLYLRAGLTQPEAVTALYQYVHAQVADAKGRTAPGEEDVRALAALPCGCARHYAFDSGHAVRPTRGDKSFGQRAVVTRDFLRLQNTDGYASDFAQDVIAIAHAALDDTGRKLFNLKVRTPTSDSPNRLMAVAVCTHDPATGALRVHAGKPWGVNFITGHVIGLTGAMRGTGERAPGNPMRAVLRVLGRRQGAKVNRADRAELDRQVRVLIRALQQHPQLRPAPAR